ncbi:hypothetical protein Hanom_Chr16g01502861 [Helianthus anomalus]
MTFNAENSIKLFLIIMDNKGLNINRPLLSVRRFSSSLTSSQKNENRKNESYLPVNKPSTESCKTGSTSRSVPFGWEHSPGRPKIEKNKQIQVTESPPSRFFKPRKIFKAECSKSRKKETSGSQNDSGEVYVDAVDTISSGEMSFNSCSASGVIGLGSDVKPSGLLRTEPRMRDVILGRFLPAARAVASDAPQRTLKKIAVKEKPQVKKSVKMDDNHNKVQDDYDSDYEYHEHDTKSFKFCGLVPRFRSVNPVHGMCMKAKSPISPANRIHAGSSSSSSFRDTDSEPARSGVYKHKSWNGALKIESTEPANLEGSKLYNRLQGPAFSSELSGSIQSTVSEQSNTSSKRKGISVRGPAFSAELSGSIQSTVSEQSNSSAKKKGISVRGPAIPFDLSGSIQSTVSERSDTSSKKKGISFRELLADMKKTNEVTEPDDQDSIIEKTVYIDTVHIAESPKKDSAPSCSKTQSSFNEPLESMHADESKHDMKGKKCKVSDADLELFGDAKGNQKLKGFQHLAPPPLPKSPSDSWLCRTLPSAKKAHTLWIPIYTPPSAVADDPKTDENDQLHSPQEQMNPMPES